MEEPIIRREHRCSDAGQHAGRAQCRSAPQAAERILFAPQPPRMQPDKARGGDDEAGVEKRVEAREPVQQQIDDDEREGRGDLRARPGRRGLRIGDHVEDEEEKRRAGERAEEQCLGRQVVAHVPGAEGDLREVENEERTDERAAPDAKDEEAERARDEEEGHRPRAAPLVRGRRGDEIAADEQRDGDAEKRGIEMMAAAERDEIFRADGEEDRQEEEVVVVRIIQQQREREAADARAERDDPAPAQKAMQHGIERAAARDGEEHLQRAAIEAQHGATERRVEREQGGEGDARIEAADEIHRRRTGRGRVRARRVRCGGRGHRGC